MNKPKGFSGDDTVATHPNVSAFLSAYVALRHTLTNVEQHGDQNHRPKVMDDLFLMKSRTITIKGGSLLGLPHVIRQIVDDESLIIVNGDLDDYIWKIRASGGKPGILNCRWKTMDEVRKEFVDNPEKLSLSKVVIIGELPSGTRLHVYMWLALQDFNESVEIIHFA